MLLPTIKKRAGFAPPPPQVRHCYRFNVFQRAQNVFLTFFIFLGKDFWRRRSPVCWVSVQFFVFLRLITLFSLISYKSYPTYKLQLSLANYQSVFRTEHFKWKKHITTLVITPWWNYFKFNLSYRVSKATTFRKW